MAQHRNTNLRAGLAATLVVLALSTVAFSDSLFVTEALQKGSVLDAAGQRLTGIGYISEVTVGETLVHPLELTGGHLVMRPGFIAKKKLMQSQAPPSTGVGDDPFASPSLATKLDGSYPNPFNPHTTISFSLSESESASLKIYDVRGRMVRTLVDGNLEAGAHEAVWDGRSDSGTRVASGVYFARFRAGRTTQQTKLVMSR